MALTVVASDGIYTSDSFTTTIQIVEQNDTPTGADNTVVMAENASYNLITSDFGYSDAEGDSLQHVIFDSIPTLGTLWMENNFDGIYQAGEELADGSTITAAELDAGYLYYSPNTDESGTNYSSLTFRVSDEEDYSDTSHTLTFDVNAQANTAPTSSDGTISVTENTDFNITTSMLNYFDADGDALSHIELVTIPDATTEGKLWLDANLNGTWDSGESGFVGATIPLSALDGGAVYFTPVDNVTGSPLTSFSYYVNDGTENSTNPYTVTVNVTAGTDPAPAIAVTNIQPALGFEAQETSLTLSHDSLGWFTGGDVNNDGNQDLLVLFDDGSNSNTTFVADLLLGDGEGGFNHQTNSSGITINGYASDPRLADLNDDGFDDLIVQDYVDGGHVVTVYTSNGDGTFFDTGIAMTGSTTARKVDVGDVNNDGIMDIMVSHKDASNILWLGGDDGSGNWDNSYTDSGQTIDGSYHTYVTKLRDLDNDGDLDAIFADYTDGVRISMNVNGTFVDSGLTLFSGGTVKEVDAQDLNADGFLDIVAVSNNSYDDAAQVFFNNGEGQVVDTAHFSTTASSSIAANASGDKVRLNDLDGDGDIDATIRIDGALQIHVNDGFGTLTHQATALDENYNPARTDLTNDSLRDFIEISGNQLTVFENISGTELISYAENSGAMLLGLGFDITDADSANLDYLTLTLSDYTVGEDWLAASDMSNITTFWDQASGTLTLSGTDTLANYTALLNSVTFESSYEPTGLTTELALTVVASDGIYTSDSFTTTIQIVEQNDTPTGADNTVVMAENASYNLITSDFGYSDAEGDSLQHVIFDSIPTLGTLWMENNFDGIYQAGEELADGSTITAAELDAGYLYYSPNTDESGTNYSSLTFRVSDEEDYSDTSHTLTFDVTSVASANAPVITLNTTTPQLGFEAPASTLTLDNNNGSWMTGGNIDGDANGNLDLLITYYDDTDTSISFNTQVLLGNGDGTFSSPASSSNVTISGYLSDPKLSDLDNDGDADLIVQDYVDGGSVTSIYFSAGDGTFTDSGIQFSGSSQARKVDVTDVNNDGVKDIFVSYKSAANALFLGGIDGNGDWYNTSGSGISIGNSTTTYMTQMVDLDGDNRKEAIMADFSGVHIWSNDGNENFTASTTLFSGGQIRELSVADLNGDSEVDIVATSVNDSDDGVQVFLNDGSGNFSTTPYTTLLTTTSVDKVRLNDLDGDGDLDATLRVDGYIEIYLGDGNGDFTYEASSLEDNTIPARINLTDDILRDFVNIDGDQLSVYENISSESLVVYTENSGAQSLGLDFSLSDSDDANLSSMTLTLSGGLGNGDDWLSTTDSGNIVSSWDEASATLTLSGSDTLANYALVLNNVMYENEDEDIHSSSIRTLTITADDGTESSDAFTADIQILAQNDAPIIVNPVNLSGVDFDGTSGYVKIGHTTETQALTGDALTLEFWMNPDDPGNGDQVLVSKFNYGDNLRAFQTYIDSDGKLGITLDETGTSTSSINFNSGYAVQANVWTHVAITFDDTQDALKLYINGDLETETTYTGSILDNSTDILLGAQLADSSTATTFYDGQLDDVRLWGVARSEDQIDDAYEQGLSGQEDGLEAYWNLDDDDLTGTTVTDSVEVSHGTLEGGSSWYSNVLALEETTFEAHYSGNEWSNVAGMTSSLALDPENQPLGIAIVDLNVGNGSGGTWEYSVDGGTNWSTISSVSETSALVLANGTDRLIRFHPPEDDSYTSDASITFKAWDGDDDATEQDYVDTTVVDESAYSTDTLTAHVNVNPEVDLRTSGGILQLDGSTYVTADAAALNVTDSSLTVEAWVNPDASLTGYSHVVSNSDTAGWELGYDADSDLYSFSVYIDGAYRIAYADSGIAGGDWHHIAGVYDGSTVTVYVDGAAQTSNASYSGNISSTLTHVLIGANPNDGSDATDHFIGMVDEVRIWDSARTTDQIDDNYDEALDASAETELLAYYDFDDTMPGTQTVEDQSNNTNHAVFGDTDAVENSDAHTLNLPTRTLDFNGSQELTLSAGADLVGNNDDMTVSLWFKAGQLGLEQALVDTRDSSGVGWLIYQDATDKLTALFYDGSNALSVSSTESVAVGEWMHITSTLDRTGNATLYINGEEENSATVTTLNDLSPTAGATLAIGDIGDASSSVSPLTGSLSEITLWDRALDATDTAELMHGVDLTDANLVAYWPMQEQTGSSTLSDLSSNGHDITLSVGISDPTLGSIIGPELYTTHLYTDEDMSIDGTLEGFDAEGTAMTFAIHTDVTHGTLTVDGNSGAFSYTPDSGWLGDDTFTITVTDGDGQEYDQTLTVTTEGEPMVGTAPEVGLMAHQDVMQFNDEQYVQASGINLSNTSFTIETWINRAHAGEEDYFISQGSSVADNGMFIGFNTNDDLNFGWFGDHLSVAATDIDSGNTTLTDAWYHVAATYDADTNTQTLYVNGSQVGTSHTTTMDLQGDSSDLFIGKYSDNDTLNFAGQMDDVRVWDYARDASEIEANWDITVDTTNTSLMANYTFDNIAYGESTVTDHSTYNNDASMGSVTVGDTAEPLPLNHLGTAAKFDNTNDYYMNNTSNSITTVDNFTMETWFKWDGTDAGTDQGLVVNGNSSGGQQIILAREAADTFSIQGYYANAIDTFDTNYVIDANLWYHVALVRDNGTTKMYVNGEEQTLTATSLTSTPDTPAETVIIGTNSAGTMQFYGELDEVRMWEASLDQTTIQEQMTQPLSGSEVGLVGYWNINGSDTSSLVDQAGTNDLAQQGTPYFVSNAPDVVEESITTTFETSISSRLDFWDEEDGSGSGTITTAVSHGTMELDTDAGTFTYTPDAGWAGDDTFVVQSTDSDGNTVDQTLTITTEAEGSAPVVQLAAHQGAMQFDGNDYLIAEGVSVANSSYTLEAWVNRASNDGSYDLIMSQGAANSAEDNMWFGFTGTDTLALTHYDTQISFDISAYNGSDSMVGDWYHVAASYNVADGEATLYINGQQVGSPVTLTTDFTDTTGTSMYIGSDQWQGTVDSFDGMIDNVRVWGDLRSATEIAEGYNQAWPNNEDNLLANYDFNIVVDDTVFDSNETGRHAQMGSTTASDDNDPTYLGHVGAAVTFDGQDDYYQSATAATANTDDFTIESWFMWDGTDSGLNQVITSNGDGAASGFGLMLNWDAADSYSIQGMLGGSGSSYDSGVTVAANTWYHVAMVRDTGTTQMYVNGSAVGTTVTASPLTASATMTIGGDYQGSQLFNGQIDEVRVWSDALDQATVQKVMSQQLDGGETSLAGYWDLSIGAHAGVVDMSSASNDLVGFGSPTLAFNAPLLVDNYYVTASNVSITSAAIATDADGDTLTSSVTDGADHGVIEYVSQAHAWKYSPSSDYVGTDEFVVTVLDEGGNSVATQINIFITPEFTGSILGGADQVGDTLTGTSLNDLLSTGLGNQVLNGGDGDDFIEGGDGADELNGGEGDDLLVWDAADSSIDGGNGHDTLVLFEEDYTFDLSNLGSTTLSNIEEVDITGDGAVTMQLTVQDVLDLATAADDLPYHQLVVHGNSDDTVEASGGWTQDADVTVNDANYNSYSNGLATLLVDADITNQNIS
ncbi:LamG-like jellyroll fold domain-containing protein [Magnetococcus sp. PR-3]|uniref:LamG-like jellyroll fold domain-containing protein n=1 Tax=Magnetococcus sp. PR-3 TaxID=3120355 RepID=UPI002FCE47CF